ncbi:sensor histidine kinase [Winogradskyella sp. SM1960]|uniref:tetratricopeptide repeat-containing sensor histidine kinase n=1 Tax=Winogradskyella sp. SM1960 TaxID=2865955 RepID=UPI001CD34F3F|nr:sensor histidine kinase [Winogradskyella sp. SM1960]
MVAKALKLNNIICGIFIIVSLQLVHGQKQDVNIEAVNTIKQNINQSKKTIQLKWMDSLLTLIRDTKGFKYDSIARETIDFSIQLDSFNLAAYHTANLINYNNNFVGNPKEGVSLFNKYYPILETHISLRNKASLYIDSGDSYYYIGKVDKSIEHYDKAIFYADKDNNQRIKAFAILYKGYAYNDEGQFVEASKTLINAVKIFENVKDTFNIIGAKNSLGIVYSKNGFLEEANTERNEALVLAKKTNSIGQIATLEVNAAADFRKTKDYEKQIKSLQTALAASKQSRFADDLYPRIVNPLILAYVNTDSLDRAKFYLKKIENSDKNYTQGVYESSYIKSKQQIELADKNYNQALQLGTTYLTIVNNSNNVNNIEHAERFLSQVYDSLGNDSKAFFHYKNAKHIEDSIYNIQKTKALSYYQTLYETEKRDAMIKAQESDILLLDSKNRVKNQWLIFGSLGLLGLFSIVYLYRSKQFLKKKEQLQKVFAQDLLRNIERERSRISSELHDSIGQSLLLIRNKIVLNDDVENSNTSLVDNAIHEVRTISQDLHPFQFEKLGLIKSLKYLIEKLQNNSNIFYSEDIDELKDEIPIEQTIFVYRMIQECLNNVEKHSEAKACQLNIEEVADAVTFEVKDNGIGFDLTEGIDQLNSLGMQTLKERAKIINAQLSISSTKGKGTTVIIKVPKK